jgi:hypothetical protein
MEPERPRHDEQAPFNDGLPRPDAAAPARPPLLDPPVAVEAVFAFLLSGLLCWNAWPWIAAQAAGETGTPGGPSAIIRIRNFRFIRRALMAGDIGLRLSRSSSQSRTDFLCSLANCRASRQQTPMSPWLSMTRQKMSQ